MKINIHEYPIGATPLELARYQVAVMEAAETGAVVEYTRNWEDHEWEEIETPSWDWTDSSYRIKPAIIANGSNPKNLTEEKVGVKDGWRLLTKEECKVRMIILKNHKDIQMLTKDEWMTGDGYGYYGNCVDECYRTKKPDGYFLQSFPESFYYVPWTIDTVPMGTVLLRLPNHDDIALVTVWRKNGVRANGKEYTYQDIMENEYSVDNGKTWKVCAFLSKK